MVTSWFPLQIHGDLVRSEVVVLDDSRPATLPLDNVSRRGYRTVEAWSEKAFLLLTLRAERQDGHYRRKRGMHHRDGRPDPTKLEPTAQ